MVRGRALPNTSLSWHIRCGWIQITVVHRSAPGRTVCLSGSEAEGGSVLVFASTDPVPLGGHGETPWPVGASMFCFWLASSSPPSLSSALGSGFPAGWGSGTSRRGSGFRPAVGLGFVSGASGQHET